MNNLTKLVKYIQENSLKFMYSVNFIILKKIYFLCDNVYGVYNFPTVLGTYVIDSGVDSRTIRKNVLQYPVPGRRKPENRERVYSTIQPPLRVLYLSCC